MVRGLFSLCLCCSRVPSFSPCRQEGTFLKPLRCCWPWRPKRGFLDRFPRMSVHYPGALCPGPSMSSSCPSITFASRKSPALQSGEAMPHSKHAASAGRAWSFLRARCQPSTPNPGGKEPSDGSYLISAQQPRRRIHLLGGTWRPQHPFPAADGCSVSPMAAPQL